MSLSVSPPYSVAQTAETSPTSSSTAQASADSSQPKPTLSQQIKQLEEQGEDAKQIAAALGTTVSIIDVYLDGTTDEQATEDLSSGTTIQITA